ncbi:peptidoglycan recognition family protein [Kibdelosporangium persicum]|uniref:N-acetylmuramoyl-L-alanine amidase n=1 Tax=Kibdelosporangium persicum TaxID=2698649 RepID=A0ABX2F9Q6_9PSEU|nr:peptidoglycan recognition family protein [Kibdelosporangium persicum]NRN67655.1 N-acetylmuramoyl-L-alanine amidase [Kibdelosporangium persicum]
MARTPRIILRGEWGAAHDNGSGSAPLPASEMWLHHSVTIAPDVVAPFDDDYAAVRALEAVGEQRFGRGISYTWAITPSGLIFEGHSVGRLGAHTGGRNSIARAICFIGNYDVQRPTNAQIQAAAWVLQEAQRHGWIRHARLNGGHRDVKATSCPGQHAYAAIGLINSLAAGPPITAITEEDDLSWTENLTFTAPDGKVTTIQARDWVMWTNYAAWIAANNTAVTNAKLDSMAGSLTTDQATLLAAIGRDATQVDLTDEQTELLLNGLSEATARKLYSTLAGRFAHES